MRYPAAPMDRPIKIVTGLTLSVCVAMFVAQFWIRPLIIPGLIILVISIGCYLRSPVAYEMSSGNLTVALVWGSLVFPSVSSCRVIGKKMESTTRLWGNGGLFAATGWFWNAQHGKFRAYLSSSRPENMVMLETAGAKVLVSPADPGAFAEAIKAHSI